MAQLISNASAYPVRWDFAGTVDGITGTGSYLLPGVGTGATLTGFIIADTEDFGLVYDSRTPEGHYLTFADSRAFMSWTVSYDAKTYTSTWPSTYIDASMAVARPGIADGVGFWGGNMSVGKFTSEPLMDSSFQSFLSGMATDLTPGGGTFMIGGNGWLNSHSGSLSTLTQTIIPEPSFISIFGVGVGGLIARQRKKA